MRTTSSATLAIRYGVQKQSGLVTRTFVNDAVGITTSTLTRSDVVVNPIRSDGWRKPSPYSAVFSTAEPGYHHMELLLPSGKAFETYGKINPNNSTAAFTVSPASLSALMPLPSDIDKAVIKARNNVADRVASFGESLAELKQSLSGLGTLASQVDQFVVSALKKDYKGVAKSLGIPHRSRKHRRAVTRYNNLGVPTVSNAFLTWNFGLAPIISDMVSLAILMGESKPLRVVGKGLFPRENGKERTFTQTCVQPWSGVGYQVNFRRKLSSGTYVRLDYECSFERLRSLTAYGLMDAPATAWALVPSSWLIDFVIPVGEVLRSLTATFGLTFRGGTATRFVSDNRKFSYCNPPSLSNGQIWKQFHIEAPDHSGKAMERTVFKDEPNPVTLWVKDPLSAFSVSAVFSLLGQKLRLK